MNYIVNCRRKKEREENNHKLHEELKKKELSRSELDKSNVLKSPNKPEKVLCLICFMMVYH